MQHRARVLSAGRGKQGNQKKEVQLHDGHWRGKDDHGLSYSLGLLSSKVPKVHLRSGDTLLKKLKFRNLSLQYHWKNMHLFVEIFAAVAAR